MSKERRASEPSPRSGEVDRFKLLVESVRDYAIFILNVDGTVATWNPGAERFKGYKAEEIIGRHFSVFYPPEDIETRKPWMELEVAAKVGRFEDEGWRLRKDGTRFWANVVITAMRDPSGKLIGFGKVTRDLSERRQAEERLRRSEERLRKSNQELEEYAAFVSHDLQEPLRKMASFAELLARRYKDKVDDEGRQFIGYIVEGATRMRTLITDVLDYSRIGRAEPEAIEVDLKQVVDSVLGDLEVAIKEAGAKVSVSPLPRVMGSVSRLSRVFLNLVSNALKYRDRSRTLEIAIDCERLDGECVVRIRDNGIGFDQKEAEAILRPFKRLHAREVYPGTGLGLATVKKIVAMHGGRVWAKSQLGSGSEFFVALPCLPT